MRKFRIAVIGLFLLSLVGFIVFNIVDRVTSDHTAPTITSESDTISVTLKPEENEEDSEEGAEEDAESSGRDDADLYQGLRRRMTETEI